MESFFRWLTLYLMHLIKKRMYKICKFVKINKNKKDQIISVDMMVQNNNREAAEIEMTVTL